VSHCRLSNSVRLLTFILTEGGRSSLGIDG
jgi:hypothetical protein